MKIKNMIFGIFTAAAIFSSGITVSADNITVKTDVYQPDEICGYLNIHSSTIDNVYVKVIKHTPETDIDEGGESIGYPVYDTFIDAVYIHASDIMVFPLEYNNYNYETKKYEGKYDILIGVHKHFGSTDPSDIVYNKVNLVVKDTNYCGYKTKCKINVEIVEDDLDKPLCVESGNDHDKTYNMTFSSVTAIIGDADNNNVLNIRDAAFIARMIAKGKTNELPKHADYNGDGEVTIRDAAAIAIFLAGQHKQ